MYSAFMVPASCRPLHVLGTWVLTVSAGVGMSTSFFQVTDDFGNLVSVAAPDAAIFMALCRV